MVVSIAGLTYVVKQGLIKFIYKYTTRRWKDSLLRYKIYHKNDKFLLLFYSLRNICNCTNYSEGKKDKSTVPTTMTKKIIAILNATPCSLVRTTERT